MKRKITSFVLALVIACSLFSMTACGKKEEQQNIPENATMTFVIAAKNTVIYEIELSKVETDKGLMPVLEYLRAEKGLKFEYTQLSSGIVFSKLGDLVPRDDTHLYFFTTVEKDRDTTTNSRTVKFEGKQLYSAGVGVNKMTIEPGCIIYVGTLAN